VLAASLACRDAADARHSAAPAAAVAPTPTRAEGPPREAPALIVAITALLAAPKPSHALAAFQLDAAGVAAKLAAPYRRLAPGYAAHFPEAMPALLDRLRAHASGASRASGSSAEAGVAPPPVAVRRHYGDDPALSLQQARLRWAMPVQAESWLVELDGELLDTVWVEHSGRWFALLGLDDAALDALAAFDAACAELARRAGRAGGCSDASWMAIDAALADDAERVARACARAQTFCLAAAP
jgi:hypothetical protein